MARLLPLRQKQVTEGLRDNKQGVTKNATGDGFPLSRFLTEELSGGQIAAKLIKGNGLYCR